MAEIFFETPTGILALREADGTLVGIRWQAGARCGGEETPLLAEARRQILAYFAGCRRDFDLPLSLRGTDFQRAVWRAMAAIPYGAVRTYGDLARDLDANARAVGAACGRNPVPIVIPCHRVVGGGGRLTGFSGGDGIETKRALLRLEGAMLI
ncbi:MAG: methylated-DNA--[protein]-cysteine S-methyltransferase [Alphaproteobacteria bacterium]